MEKGPFQRIKIVPLGIVGRNYGLRLKKVERIEGFLLIRNCPRRVGLFLKGLALFQNPVPQWRVNYGLYYLYFYINGDWAFSCGSILREKEIARDKIYLVSTIN